MANQPPTQMSSGSPQGKKDFKEKFKEYLSTLRSNQKVDNLVSYATANTRDTISYVVLIFGIVLLFFYPFYGGLLIGLIAGFYFSSEILAFLRIANDFIDEQGIVKSLIGGGLLLGLFICAPAIFIGIACAVAIRHILFPETK